MRKYLGLSTCTFLCYCFLTCLGYIILGAGRGSFSYGLGVFDLSHEEVKRAVGLDL